MPMPPYLVGCYEPGCAAPAVYKIAARWSDGLTSELKTYGLTCAEHLRAWFQHSLQKQHACRKAHFETLDKPGIYALVRGARDVQLQRLEDLEKEVLSAQASPGGNE